MKNMPPPDLVGLAPERAPVKRSPMSILQINKACKNAENDYGYQDAFLVHEWGSSAPRSRNAKWETATQR